MSISRFKFKQSSVAIFKTNLSSVNPSLVNTDQSIWGWLAQIRIKKMINRVLLGPSKEMLGVNHLSINLWGDTLQTLTKCLKSAFSSQEKRAVVSG